MFENKIDNECIILHAYNGKEAIEICKNNTDIDIVIMDLKMPEMTGFEATEIIKKMYPNLPVIAQTGFTTKEDREKALSAGCDDFITKPIKEDLFIELINKHFGLI